MGCLFLAAGCAQESASPPPQPPIVTVAHAVEREVIDFAEFTGRVEALEYVQIQARASGHLLNSFFMPGSDVKKGEVLFEIDPRPYQAMLDQNKARLQQAQAKVKQVQADFTRVEELLKREAATQSEFDAALADRDMAVANVAAARADVESAQLDLDFCTIRSPLNGRISKSAISIGNLVTKDQTLLTTVVSDDPIFMTFAVDEVTMLRVQQLAKEGKIKLHNEVQVPVSLGLANEQGFPHAGTIDFADNQVRPGTGTIQVRGVFPNADRLLRPGLFARVRVPVSAAHNVLLVPDRAIVSDQSRKLVLTVNDKNEVVPRPVTVGAMHDGLRAIESGLQPNERIIVEGLMWARPGATVTPKAEEALAMTKASPPER